MTTLDRLFFTLVLAAICAQIFQLPSPRGNFLNTLGATAGAFVVVTACAAAAIAIYVWGIVLGWWS